MIGLGPFRLWTGKGSLDDLAAGRTRAVDPDEGLPSPNSLRRAGDEAKMAVRAAAEVLSASGVAITDRVGLYVAEQQAPLEFCARFIEASVKEGPRLASPMLFAESVANNAATHLSLTLGLTGGVQTFIGTRPAGIQALQAAADDLADGTVETGLVVVLGTSTRLLWDAYDSVFRPMRRRPRPKGLDYLRGAAAFLVRRDAGSARLLHAGVRCEGRRAVARALAALWGSLPGDPGRVLVSGFQLCEARDRRAVAQALGGRDVVWGDPGPEAFALDPLLRLLIDARRAPGPGRRTLFCLSEEGTAGVCQLDGEL